jgi:hypothetical protein
MNSEQFLNWVKWSDGSGLQAVSSKQIYNMLKSDSSIFAQVNCGWGLDFSISRWQFIFNSLWHSPCEPKKSCFRWLLLLKKLAVGNTLPHGLGDPIVCSVCDVPETFEHLFFYCKFAKGIWSIFFGVPIVWDSRMGLSWSEVLAGFVESFDVKTNIFWYVLTGEILWYLWKERNGEIFEKRRRLLTEFKCKLTHFYIMSQVAAALEISEDRFMILMREGQMLIHKDEVVSVKYLTTHKDMLGKREMERLTQFMMELKIDDDSNCCS